MSRTRRVIWATLILLIAYLAQKIWMSELNGLVWKFTWIGEQVALKLAPPNYDSALSTQIFQTFAILINATVYAAVLWPIHLWLDRWKLKRAARKAQAKASKV